MTSRKLIAFPPFNTWPLLPTCPTLLLQIFSSLLWTSVPMWLVAGQGSTNTGCCCLLHWQIKMDDSHLQFSAHTCITFCTLQTLMSVGRPMPVEPTLSATTSLETTLVHVKMAMLEIHTQGWVKSFYPFKSISQYERYLQHKVTVIWTVSTVVMNIR